jgi:hypothetical protein
MRTDGRDGWKDGQTRPDHYALFARSAFEERIITTYITQDGSQFGPDSRKFHSEIKKAAGVIRSTSY